MKKRLTDNETLRGLVAWSALLGAAIVIILGNWQEEE
jgi:hypothetical protein